MLITAVILNLSLVLLFQTSAAYDSRFDELDTADLSVTVPSALSYHELADELVALDGVLSVETEHALFASAALQEFQGSEFTMNTYFYKFSDDRTISKHSIEEKMEHEAGDGTYRHLLFLSSW